MTALPFHDTKLDQVIRLVGDTIGEFTNVFTIDVSPDGFECLTVHTECLNHMLNLHHRLISTKRARQVMSGVSTKVIGNNMVVWLNNQFSEPCRKWNSLGRAVGDATSCKGKDR